MNLFQLFVRNSDVVPVVMFHSVGLNDRDWIYSHLSEDLEIFEKKIRILKKFGYKFLFWSDLYNHMSGKNRIKYPSVMLTFDDGYLDNWIYVFPILKKHGVKATIFVNPEFVDPSIHLRPNLDSMLAGENPAEKFTDLGFLNWEEMRVMTSSGLIDIQSHALTHTWYPSNPRIVGLHTPGQKRYPWMAWNRYKEKKPYYMCEDQSGLIPLGAPIYEHEKALVCRQFFPPQEIEEGMKKFVEQNGAVDFFSSAGYESKFRNEYQRLWSKFGHKSEYESEEEYQKRIFRELTQSKLIIEQQLNKSVDYICWPGGGYNKQVLLLAKSAGYKAWTLSSKDDSFFRNKAYVTPEQIKRISSFTYYRSPSNRQLDLASAWYFLSALERHRGSAVYKWIGRGLFLKSKALEFLKGLNNK